MVPQPRSWIPLLLLLTATAQEPNPPVWPSSVAVFQDGDANISERAALLALETSMRCVLFFKSGVYRDLSRSAAAAARSQASA